MTDPGPARAEPQRAASERVMLEEWVVGPRAQHRKDGAPVELWVKFIAGVR